MAGKADSEDNEDPKAGAGEQKPRLRDTNPDGIYSGAGLRNAIQGDGFLPGYGPTRSSQPKKK